MRKTSKTDRVLKTINGESIKKSIPLSVSNTVGDDAALQEAIDHTKEVCDRMLVTTDTGDYVGYRDFMKHLRLLRYLRELQSMRASDTAAFQTSKEQLLVDIDYLLTALESKEFSCESCKKDHLQLYEWMVELLQRILVAKGRKTLHN